MERVGFIPVSWAMSFPSWAVAFCSTMMRRLLSRIFLICPGPWARFLQRSPTQGRFPPCAGAQLPPRPHRPGFPGHKQRAAFKVACPGHLHFGAHGVEFGVSFVHHPHPDFRVFGDVAGLVVLIAKAPDNGLAHAGKGLGEIPLSVN